MESDLAAKLTEKLAYWRRGLGREEPGAWLPKNLPGAKVWELLWCCAGLESWAHRASRRPGPQKPPGGMSANMVLGRRSSWVAARSLPRVVIGLLMRSPKVVTAYFTLLPYREGVSLYARLSRLGREVMKVM